MQLTTETFGDVVVVHTPDEVTAENAADLERCLTSLDRVKVVVDLDNTESLDSAGLTALLNAQDHLRQEGGDLKVFVTNSVNRKILEITRLDQQLDVFSAMVDAVKSFA